MLEVESKRGRKKGSISRGKKKEKKETRLVLRLALGLHPCPHYGNGEKEGGGEKT